MFCHKHVGWMFLLGICSLAARPVFAQSSSSMFGGSSPSNRSASGMNSMGSSNFGGSSSALGGGGTGGFGSGFGAAGSGGTGMGGANRGQTGMGANGARNQGGANQGNFVGRNGDPNQFIGINNLTGGNAGQNNNRQSQRGQGNRNGNNGNNGNTQNQNMNAANNNQMPALRARQKIGFAFTRPQTARLQTQIQTRFAKLTQRNANLKDVTFSTDESGAVVLQGEVASASAAKLAEKLVRLEPGVKVVRSELTYPALTAE